MGYQILMWCFLFIAVIGMFSGWRKTYQVSYYETLLERYQNEAGIKLPDNYWGVKKDYWMWLR